jgi:hypothetical protein
MILFPPTVPAQSGTRGRSGSTLEKQIKDLEERRFRALVDNDLGALERILADDLQYTHSNGQVENKADFLKRLRTGELKYEAIAPEGMEVRTYGNAAVTTGRALVRVKTPEGVRTIRLRYTDVYVKRKGRWKMVAWQSTRLNP